MECRHFQLTLTSANDLKNVRRLFRMQVYAKVSIAGSPKTKKRTPVDKHGGTNPVWNHTVKYSISESAVCFHGVMVVIKLYCKRTLGDRYIGEVSMSIKQLFDHAQPLGGSAEVSFPVKKGSGKSKGILKFAYWFGEREVVESSSGWKKLFKYGAAILLNVTLLSTVGIPIFIDPEIIDDAGTAR